LPTFLHDFSSWIAGSPVVSSRENIAGFERRKCCRWLRSERDEGGLAAEIYRIYNKSMRITCDPAKRAKTLEERDLDMRHAAQVFAGKHFTAPDDRADCGEPRYITVGEMDGRMVVLVWTPRGIARRIISMRKANAREQEKYANYLD
jgi:uncharacterized protein